MVQRVLISFHNESWICSSIAIIVPTSVNLTERLILSVWWSNVSVKSLFYAPPRRLSAIMQPFICNERCYIVWCSIRCVSSSCHIRWCVSDKSRIIAFGQDISLSKGIYRSQRYHISFLSWARYISHYLLYGWIFLICDCWIRYCMLFSWVILIR